MSDFKAKMYQIQFRLGLIPRPAGELTALPQTLSWIKASTSKGRGGDWKGKGKKGREWRGGETPPLHAPVIHISDTPL